MSWQQSWHRRRLCPAVSPYSLVLRQRCSTASVRQQIRYASIMQQPQIQSYNQGYNHRTSRSTAPHKTSLNHWITWAAATRSATARDQIKYIQLFIDYRNVQQERKCTIVLCCTHSSVLGTYELALYFVLPDWDSWSRALIATTPQTSCECFHLRHVWQL